MPSAKYLFFWNIYGTKNSVIITSFLHFPLILNRLGLVTKGRRSQKMLVSHIRLRSYETGLLSFTYFRLFTRRLQAGILILVVVIFMFFFFQGKCVWKNDGFGWASIRSVHVSSCITWQTLKKNKWLHDLLTSWGNFCDDVLFVCLFLVSWLSASWNSFTRVRVFKFPSALLSLWLLRLIDSVREAFTWQFVLCKPQWLMMVTWSLRVNLSAAELYKSCIQCLYSRYVAFQYRSKVLQVVERDW